MRRTQLLYSTPDLPLNPVEKYQKKPKGLVLRDKARNYVVLRAIGGLGRIQCRVQSFLVVEYCTCGLIYWRQAIGFTPTVRDRRRILTRYTQRYRPRRVLFAVSTINLIASRNIGCLIEWKHERSNVTHLDVERRIY